MIPFRKQRLATTVTNRILNLANELPPISLPGAPAAPGPVPGGPELAAATQTPPEPVTAAPEVVEEVALIKGGML